MATKKHPLDGYDYVADVPPGTPLVVADYSGKVWRLAKRGIRYHSDVRTRLHGAKPARAPKAFAASERLRALIDDILRTGSRDALPAGSDPTKWTDQRPDSYAQRPHLELHGAIARAVRPVYDGITQTAWRELTARELKRVQSDLLSAPRGVHMHRVAVQERTKTVYPDSPRYERARKLPGARERCDLGVVVPITQWRTLPGAEAGVREP